MVAYKFTDELINVDVAMAFAEAGEAGARVFRGKTWSELIYIFCRRAREVEAGIGVITSAWWEPQHEVNWSGRRYSGVVGKAPTSMPVEEQAAPRGFAGLSPFALPRVLRQVLRCGTGIVDLDLNLSHLQVQIHGNAEMPITRAIVLDRDFHLREILRSPWGIGKTLCDAKRLLVKIVYGMDLPTKELPAFMAGFKEEQLAFTRSAFPAPCIPKGPEGRSFASGGTAIGALVSGTLAGGAARRTRSSSRSLPPARTRRRLSCRGSTSGWSARCWMPSCGSAPSRGSRPHPLSTTASRAPRAGRASSRAYGTQATL